MSEKQISKIIVRGFVDKDFDQINQLWQLTDMGGVYRGDNLIIINSTIKNGGTLFVLEDVSEQKIIGSSWLTNDSRRIYLHHFAIHPDFQGRGLSHLLLNESLQWVKQIGLQVKLEVHRNNIKAISLYQKYGFSNLGDYMVQIIRDVSIL